MADVGKESDCALGVACEGLRSVEETVWITRALLEGEQTALGRGVAGFQRKMNAKDLDRMVLLRATAAHGKVSACELGATHKELMSAEKELSMI